MSNHHRVGYFTDSKGDKSMTRLLTFMSFFPATATMCYIHSAEALGVYLVAYAGMAANGKWAERNNGMDSSKLEITEQTSRYISDSSDCDIDQSLATKSARGRKAKTRPF